MNNKEIFYKKIINELHSSYKNHSNLLILSFYYFAIDNFIKTKEFDYNNPVHRYFTHVIDINYELYQSKSYRSEEDLINYNTNFDLKNKALNYLGFEVEDNYDIETDILDSFEILNYIIQNIFEQSYLLSHNYTIKMNDNELKEVINDLFQPIYELPKNQHQEVIQFLSISKEVDEFSELLFSQKNHSISIINSMIFTYYDQGFDNKLNMYLGMFIQINKAHKEENLIEYFDFFKEKNYDLLEILLPSFLKIFGKHLSKKTFNKLFSLMMSNFMGLGKHYNYQYGFNLDDNPKEPYYPIFIEINAPYKPIVSYIVDNYEFTDYLSLIEELMNIKYKNQITPHFIFILDLMLSAYKKTNKKEQLLEFISFVMDKNNHIVKKFILNNLEKYELSCMWLIKEHIHNEELMTLIDWLDGIKINEKDNENI